LIKVKVVQSFNNYQDFKFTLGISEFVSRNPICIRLLHKTDLDDFRPIHLTNKIIQKTKFEYFEQCSISVNEIIRENVQNTLRFEVLEVIKDEKYEVKCEKEIPANEIFLKTLNLTNQKDEHDIIHNVVHIDKRNINNINEVNTTSIKNKDENIEKILLKEIINKDIDNKNELDLTDTQAILLISKSKKFQNYLLIKQLEVVKTFKFYDYLISNLEIKNFFFMDLTRSKININYLEIFASYNSDSDKDNENDDYGYYGIVKHKKKKNKKKNDKKNEEDSIINLLKEERQIEEEDWQSFDEIIGKKKKKKKEIDNLIEDIDDKVNRKIMGKIALINPKEEFQTCFDFLIRNLIKIDSSKGFSVFGLGAKLPPLFDTVNNCFSLNLNMFNPEVNGYLGMFDSYTKILSKVDLYGPANLSESLESFLNFLSSEKFDHKEQFYALGIFIVTSRITDIVNSIMLLNKTSHYPCSVIVIGCGDEYQLETKNCPNEYEFLNKMDTEEPFEYIHNTYGVLIKTRPFRPNTQFIDFFTIFEEYGQGLRKESVGKLILKSIFSKISNQFLNYVNKIGVPPIDFFNLHKKTHAHFMEFKKEKLNEVYSIPSYMISEKEKLIAKLNEIGLSEKDLNEYFKTLPSMEINYILSTINYYKNFHNRNKYITTKRNDDQMKEKRKKYLLMGENIFIDERHQLKKKKEYFDKVKSENKMSDKLAILKIYKINREKFKKEDENEENDYNKINMIEKIKIENEEIQKVTKAYLSSNNEEESDENIFNNNINKIGVNGKKIYSGNTGYDMMKKFNLDKDDLLINPNNQDFLIDDDFFNPRSKL
jgi:hypothetical protein